MMKQILLAACLLPVALHSADGRLRVQDGVLTRHGKPFFPLGFVFGCDDAGLRQAKSVGMNSVHQEYGMPDVFPDGPQPDAAGIARIRAMHDLVRAHGMAFFPLLNGHYIPQWLANRKPAPPVDATGRTVGLWFPFSIHDPIYRATLEQYWRTVAEAVGGDDNSAAFVMWNEAGYGMDVSSPAMRNFRLECRRKYGEIKDFNRQFGTAFTDFEQIAPPAVPADNRKLFREFYRFQQRSYSEFFAWERRVFRAVAPEAVMTNKNPLTVLSGEAMYCNDISMLSASQDVFGCDFYGGSLLHFRNMMEAARSLNGNGGPVVSYETHAQRGLGELKPAQAALQLFVQILGGCRGMFLFCAGSENPDYGFFNDKATPPAVRAELTRLFQLIRDQQPLFAARRNPAEIAVLVSDAATLLHGSDPVPTRRDDYARMVGMSYDLVRNNHFACDFIASRQLAQKSGRYRILVIPSLSILTRDELTALEAFRRDGGKLLVFGGALERDENNELLPNPPAVLGLKSRAPSPWNRSMMRLVEVVPELADAFESEISVLEPEIVNPVPPEKELIPGAVVGTETGRAYRALAGNQDAYPSILADAQGKMVYCAFRSVYSGELARLTGALIERILGGVREISICGADGREALGILSACSEIDGRRIVMLANSGAMAQTVRVRLPGESRGALHDPASDKRYQWQDGWTVPMPAYGYKILVEDK